MREFSWRSSLAGVLLAALGGCTAVAPSPSHGDDERVRDARFVLLGEVHDNAAQHALRADALAQLPAHAHLINVSRGTVVDEAALIDALTHRRLAGAYLDVFEQEPLPAESPLWRLDNVIATPHSSGHSSGNRERVLQMFLRELARREADGLLRE